MMDTNNTQCPTAQPMCDIGPPGYSYCTYAPDKTCYANGWPPCCSKNGGVNCPKVKPPCRVRPAYCTSYPDTNCYKNGYPQCCDPSNLLKVGGVTITYVSQCNFLTSLLIQRDLPLWYDNNCMLSVPLSNPCATNTVPGRITAPILPIKVVTLVVGRRAVPNTVVSIVRRANRPAIHWCDGGRICRLGKKNRCVIWMGQLWALPKTLLGVAIASKKDHQSSLLEGLSSGM